MLQAHTLLVLFLTDQEGLLPLLFNTTLCMFNMIVTLSSSKSVDLAFGSSSLCASG